MKQMTLKITCLAAFGSAVLLAVGCKTVVRENIIASVETGLGVTLAENPKTELYEAKVGFIRSQFYSIPTGKVVENEDNDSDEVKTAEIMAMDKSGTNTTVIKEEMQPSGNLSAKADKRSNRADITPEVVSGIRVNSGIQHLFLGADISENFAVGKEAVKSQAAIAMYIAQANSDATAGAAALAVAASTKSVSLASTNLADMLPLQNAYLHFYGDTNKIRVFDSAVKAVTLTGDEQPFADFRKFMIGVPQNATKQQIIDVRTKLETNAEIKPFIK